MSYSFTVRTPNKSEAKAKVAEELALVVQGQPMHAKDRAAAQKAADDFIDMLPDDDSKDVRVQVHGSIGWSGTWDTPGCQITSVSLGVSGMLVPR